MASLHRTISFTVMICISMLITHNLNFDMSRVFNKFFYVDCGIPKCRFCFSTGHLECLFKFFFLPNDPHSFSTAAGRGFNNNRINYFRSNFFCLLNFRYNSIASRNNRYPVFPHGIFRKGFIAHCIDHFRGRSDELDI